MNSAVPLQSISHVTGLNSSCIISNWFNSETIGQRTKPAVVQGQLPIQHL